jgi:hypothetical protein
LFYDFLKFSDLLLSPRAESSKIWFFSPKARKQSQNFKKVTLIKDYLHFYQISFWFTKFAVFKTHNDEMKYSIRFIKIMKLKRRTTTFFKCAQTSSDKCKNEKRKKKIEQ